MFTLGYSFRPGRRRRRSPTARRSSSTSARRPAETGSTARSASATRSSRARVVVARRRGGPSTSSGPTTGETVADHLQLPPRLQRLLPLRRAATRPTSRAPSASRGEIVHPQQWPEDLDYAGKRVVVIGSGATAVTLVPAMAETRRARDDAPALAELRRRAAGRSTRSPSSCAACCRAKLAYSILRWKNVLMTMLVFQLSRRRPGFVKRMIRRGVERQLPPGYDIDTHFKPRLQPVGPAHVPGARRRPVRGDQRRQRDASSPTGSRRSPRTGCALESGAELEADVVVTATGLNLLPFGGIELDRRRRARSSCPRHDGLQGDDAQRRARTWRSRSATRTPRGR